MRTAWLLGIALAVGCAGNDRGRIQLDIRMPAELDATLVCTPGETVTLEGELVLEGLAAELVFANNVKRTHEHAEELAASLALVAAGESLAIPTQVEGEPVEAPTVSIQLVDAAGAPLGDEILLGTCGAEPLAVSATVALPATVALSVAAAGCHNHPGPTITVDGDVTFAGISRRVIVRDGDTIIGETTAPIDVVALPVGETLSFPKQPSRGGVGGNPWIWARLFDDDGEALSEELLLGRCVELSGEDAGEEEAE